MLKNYIKYAIRFLKRNKMFTLINCIGLTASLTSFLLILSYIQYEISYDDFIKDKEDVYRINLVRNATGQKASAIGPPMGPALENDFSEVEATVRLRHANSVLVQIEEEEFYENQVFYVDSSFFDVFSFPLSKGNPDKVLSEKNSVVISEKLAQKYFGDKDPIGQFITLENDLLLKITGVLDTPPSPSHLDLAMLISFQSFEVPFGYPVTLETWGWTSFPTYVKLQDNSTAEAFNAKFDGFITKYMGEDAAKAIGMELQPVSDIHLHSQDISERDGTAQKGDITTVYVLLAVAVLILILAIFNFTNLSTMVSLKRIKEVGVRKALGAEKKAVFWQYSIESFLIAMASMSSALIVVFLANEPLSNFLGLPLLIESYFVQYWPLILGLTLIIGFFGGAYSSMKLANFTPIKALGNAEINQNNFFSVKTLLVGLQFFITIALIIGSLVINSQMGYLQEKELGFEQENVLSIQMNGQLLTEKYALTKEVFLKNEYVNNVTSSGEMFDGNNGSVPLVSRENQEERFRINLFSANHDFAKTLGLDILEGRDFSDQYANDSTGYILNEQAIEMLGWNQEEAIGKELILNDVWPGEVIGVVKDFNYASLHENVGPIILFIPRTHVDRIYIKTKDADQKAIISSLKADWQSLHPNLPFDYTFLSSHLDAMYGNDRVFSFLVYVFSIIAIILSCMGLYAAVAYSIDARIKEIGIRKILGASVAQISLILTKRFLLLILVAAILAIPITTIFMQDWLDNFAYRIDIEPIHYILGGLITLIVTGLTLLYRTLKAANSNPVSSLRSE